MNRRKENRGMLKKYRTALICQLLLYQCLTILCMFFFLCSKMEKIKEEAGKAGDNCYILARG